VAPGVTLKSAAATEEKQRPSFVLQPPPDGENKTSSGKSVSEHEDALAYGWVEELSSSSSESEDVAWNSVLALLVQKEQDNEPCLWITKEVLATNHHGEDDEDDHRDDHAARVAAPPTELETLHSIPLRRKLRSCRYQNFYGDHRLVLELKRYGHTAVATNCSGRKSPRKKSKDTKSSHAQQIVLRCPSAASARAWVECLTEAKKRKPQMDATNANIELEIVDPSPSNEFDEGTSDDGYGSRSSRRLRHTRIVNVIDSEDDEDDYGISAEPDDSDHPVSPNSKPLAEQLQESEDRKRALKLAVKQAAAAERIRQQQEEEERKRLQEEARQKEQAAKQEAERLEKEKKEELESVKKATMERKKEVEVQRQRLAAIEKNVESIAKANNAPTNTAAAAKPNKPMTAAEKQHLRMEREIAARKRAEEERRRIEIEYEQQKKERVEKRRRDLEAQRKAAREEQKKKELRQKQKFLEREEKKEAMKAAAMKAPPKKVVKGVFSSKPSAAKDASKDPKTNSGGNLWSSLNKHMSAFEADDEERKRREAEKREEEKAKTEAEEDEEDPEVVRKRIAEQARQRVVQEDAGKRYKEGAAFKQNGRGGNQPQGTASPNSTISPVTSQHRISPPVSAHSATSSTSTQQPPQHQNLASNPKPSIPPLHHPHTQSWNKMQQPSYPPQQTQFQRPQQPASAQYHSSGTTAQGYRQQHQQPTHTPPGSYGNPVPPYQQHPRQPQQQPQQAQPQPPAKPPQPKPAPTPAPTQPQTNNGESSESAIRRNVLVQWGLLPPSMQVLKPVDQLLCSIHGVFPPSFGVPSHDYFAEWKPISRSELVSSGGILEEIKLKKAVRKVRFFLHPDKLPHDLKEDQSFLCKLLWDIINDAFEEYKKSKEDLDWM
jgi:hypothetical protein